MYEPMNINVESVRPGIREYNVVSQANGSFVSGLGRPIGCFALVGISLTIMGASVFIWARSKEGDQYAPFKTFGSTFISIGLFIFVISLVLLAEAILSGRCRFDPNSTRSSREDLRSGFHSPRSAVSPMLSRRMSVESVDEEDNRSLLSQPRLTSCRSYQTFPHPIPTVRVENEAGQSVLSKST